MSAPPKPWETARNSQINYQAASSFASPIQSGLVFALQPQGLFYEWNDDLLFRVYQRPVVYPGDKMYANGSSTPQTQVPRAPPRPPGSTVPGRTPGQPYSMGNMGNYGETFAFDFF